MIEVVLLGAVALWFVLWTRQQVVEEKSLPESSDPDLKQPEAFMITGKPYSSNPGNESNESDRPAPV